ncbi:MobF family relaxase [Ferrimicrobium sp.]|uniref:MobF family relaxase n=1 Tax=Ferrimicrobium sp. TaxID=2926050 RepID=UPI0026302939|nr:MobF family relaxase [Ferrimicrobium sp.]
MLSIAKLSIGQGYRYLMDSIAVGDGGCDPGSALTRYYAESGTPPGRWKGAGLGDLGDGVGLELGSEVSESQLWNLLGLIADPITGESVGQAIPRPKSVVGEGVSSAASGAKPVAGFDLTFSPPKSVSTLWALADEATKATIYACHERAIDLALAYAEAHVIHSRSGRNGVLQEDVHGVSAASFTHYDSRAGDPQLHDHVIVWNRVKSVSDGKWRTIDGAGLYASVVALGVLHEGILADLLTEALGVAWEERATPGGMRKSEIKGVPVSLMDAFSQRVGAIRTRRAELVGAFRESHGREATGTEILRLSQQANLETREEKVHRSLLEMSELWCERAQEHLGFEPHELVLHVCDSNDLPVLGADDFGDEMLAESAGVILHCVGKSHATFTRANVLAEVHRFLQGMRFVDPTERIALGERLVVLTLERAVELSPPELHHSPAVLRRADGTSRLRSLDRRRYTTQELLRAEGRIFAAGEDRGGPSIDQGVIKEIVGGGSGVSVGVTGGPRLSSEQQRVIELIVTSGRSVDLLVGPAGTGKSTTMAGLRSLWERVYGAGSVLGIAPSATAAEVLGAELAIGAENTAKWLHEWRQREAREQEVKRLSALLPHLSLGSREHREVTRKIEALGSELNRWQFRQGQLIILDEASLVGTLELDELITMAKGAGAKIVLVGDPAQLSSVGAGGMFGALVREREDDVPRLGEVRRFYEEWEREASVGLRAGDVSAIEVYDNHHRVIGGDRDAMLDALYAGWRGDVLAGKDSLMIAPDHDSVRELNVRAREERIERGEVTEAGVKLRDGMTCGIGDEIVTRENNRLLGSRNGWVKNGDRWRVNAIDGDGSLWVRRIDGKGEVRLPGDYVTSSVELGYATTVYRAQGRTVTSAHTLVGAGTTIEVLYVGVTRGREANHLYVDTGFGEEQSTSHGPSRERGSAREVLVGCLANSGVELGATETIRVEQEGAESIGCLFGEYETIARLAEEARYQRLLEALAIPGFEELRTSEAYGSLLIALRGAEARGIDLERDLTLLVGEEKDQLSGVEDTATVMAERVRSWTEKYGARELGKAEFIVGLMPKARGVDDQDFGRALEEREYAIRQRAFALVERALLNREPWILGLGSVPRDPKLELKWKNYAATVAAYRELRGISPSAAYTKGSMATIAPQQTSQRRQVRTAIQRARRIAEIASGGSGESQTFDPDRSPSSDWGVGWPPIPTV